jgi:hypothetical protein
MKATPYRFRTPGVLTAVLAVAMAASMLVLVGLLAMPGHTQTTAPPTLTGENLLAFSHGQVTSTAVNCTQDSQGEGTITYTATGEVFTGPYPGTFTESGTISTTKNAGDQFAQVTSLSAEFEIVDETGTTRVSGTKSLSEDSTARALCIEDAVVRTITLDSREVEANDLIYEASIETPSGTFIDRGTSDLFVAHYVVTDPPDQSGDQLFEESFLSYRETLLPSTKEQGKQGGY